MNATRTDKLKPGSGGRRIAKLAMAAALVSAGSLTAARCAEGGGKAWTDPEAAAAGDPDFTVQGEYLGGGVGLQAAALGEGQFYLSRFPGGLPGEGWDGSAPETATVDRDGLAEAVEGMERVERTSPTLGAEPPDGAVVLVGPDGAVGVEGDFSDGVLWAGGQTAGDFGSFRLHVEFRHPFKPSAPPSSQDRGNSGLYLHDRYEVQVLDSFGLVFDADQVSLPLKSDPKQWCACLYKFKAADVPVCFPPLTWQTYDIDFTAAQFDGDGKKTANARISVVHNGVEVHHDVELPKGTGAGGSRAEVPRGPIVFQGHGNPVAFRNVWLVER